LGVTASLKGYAKMIKEWQTRKEIIDKKLRQCGWSVFRYAPNIKVPPTTVAITEYPTESGPADYILFTRQTPIAVIEAKKASREPYDSLTQAQRYSRDFSPSSFNFGEYRIPFIYSTNGDEIWFQDLRKPENRSRKVFHFHTSDTLLELLNFDDSRAKEFLSATPNDNVFLRYYQKEAIEATEKALLQNKRKMLVAMATGTGKTIMTVSLVYRLLKSGLFKKILFLVDRRELGKQAESNFANFEPEIGLKFDKIYQVVNVEESAIPKNADVYICTIQRMYSILKGKEMPEKVIESDDPWEWDVEDTPAEYNPNIPIDSFDCIISDECHRSIYNKWKIVLDYFDAVQIGLTATPAAHTHAYFDQNLVYSYPYEKAVQDGCLVDFDVRNIATDVTISGVKIQPGQPLKVRERWTGWVSEVFPEDELMFDASEIERKITVIDRNRKIVEEVSKNIQEDQKTLVFAVDDAHADQLTKLFRERYSHLGDRFVQKITYRVDRPLERIREFRNRRYPMIAVTVDMLSTGVDIPAIENILFVRPVKSYVLLWQMMGRGTRKCPEINKTHFTIFDCAGIMEAFKDKDPKFDEIYQASQARDIREIIKQLKLKFRIEENVQLLAKKLNRISKEIDPETTPRLAEFVPEGDLGSFAASLEEKFKKDYRETLSIFENEKFLGLLEEYPRKPRYFLIDEVSRDEIIASEYLFHTLDGKNLKPEDYIKTFEKFVKQNRNKIDAIRVLLDKPKEFKSSELKELRKILASQPEIFTEDRLKRAYSDQLADIIAFIRHAASGEPLASPQERIGRTFQKLHERHKFTSGQRDWLELIKAHMVLNLTIEQDDFNDIPFSRKGGWKVADRTFDFQLSTILNEINEMAVKA
jgi:type I restriction enzyme R subunit